MKRFIPPDFLLSNKVFEKFFETKTSNSLSFAVKLNKLSGTVFNSIEIMTGIKSKVQVYSQHKLKFKFNNFFKEKRALLLKKY